MNKCFKCKVNNRLPKYSYCKSCRSSYFKNWNKNHYIHSKKHISDRVLNESAEQRERRLEGNYAWRTKHYLRYLETQKLLMRKKRYVSQSQPVVEEEK